jgi:diguanylate cyclase (GGDEF)-like protein
MATLLQQLQDQLAAAASAAARLPLLVEVAFELSDAGEPGRALRLAQEAQALAQGLGQEREYANARRAEALALLALGDLRAAWPPLSEAQGLSEALDDQPGIARGLNLTGRLLIEVGDYQGAIEAFEQSLGHYRQLGDRTREAHLLNNIAVTLADLGRVRDSRPYLEQVIEMGANLNDPEISALALINLSDGAMIEAEALRDAGQDTPAQLELKFALSWLAQLEQQGFPNQSYYWSWAINSAAILTRLLPGEYEHSNAKRALALIEGVWQEVEQSQDHLMMLDMRMVLAHAQAALGQIEVARDGLVAILSTAAALGNHSRLMMVQRALARLLAKHGRFEEALGHYQQYHRLDRQMQNEATERKIRALELRFELEQVQREAERLRARSQELERQNRQLLAEAKTLDRYAHEDALTGLANRRAFDEALETWFGRAKLTGRSFAVALVDVDHFKVVNDTYGHVMGDEVLRQIAAILRVGVRGSDLVSRYGGEEFAILLQAPGQRVVEITQRLRQSIEQFDWRSLHPAVRVTVSIGWSDELLAVADAQRLFQVADERLYQAKNAGRNRVVGSES